MTDARTAMPWRALTAECLGLVLATAALAFERPLAAALILAVTLLVVAFLGRPRSLVAAIALMALLALGWSQFTAPTPQAAERRYSEQLSLLSSASERVAREMAGSEEWSAVETFGRLERLWNALAAPDLTVLLYDSRGRSYAWMGPGLQHGLGPEVPDSGVGSRSSFAATSLFRVREMGTSSESLGARVLVGRSYSTLQPAFTNRGPASASNRWMLVGAKEDAIEGSAWSDHVRDGAPTLRLRAGAGAGQAPQLGWVAALLALGFSFCSGRHVLSEGAARALPSLIAATVAVALAGDFDREALLRAVLCVAGLWAGWCTAGWRLPSRLVAGSVGAGFVPLLLLALAQWPTPERASGALQWLFFAELSLLAIAVYGALRCRKPDVPAWLVWAIPVPLVASALLVDHFLLATIFATVSGALLAAWSGGSRRPGEQFALVALAACLGAVLQVAAEQRRTLAEAAELLAAIEAPDDDQRTRLKQEIREHFDTFDLREFALVEPRRLSSQDLAFALWSASPLARGDAHSAVLVSTPTGSSAYSFGLPIDPLEGDLDPLSRRWPTMAESPWLSESLVSDLLPVYAGGRAWGDVQYWIAPSPIGRGGERSSLDRALLPVRAADDLNAVAQLDFVASSGLASGPREPDSEWRLREEMGQSTLSWSSLRDVGAGDLWARGRIPAHGPASASRAVGLRAAASLAMVGLYGLVLLVLGLTRVRVRGALFRWFGPYSKRMVAVFTLLVVVPLSIVNLLLLRSVNSRLEREQVTRGQAALTSAQIVLEDLLANDDPGFSLDTVVTDELLLWLARVVQHEVSLYFRGTVMASSRPELFAANLLPAQIPGDVFSRITLRGEPLAVRRSRVGDLSYRELYAGLDLPGVDPGASEIVLSLPLLEQQEQATTELRQLATQSLLASGLLLALATAAGAALARRFTRPILEMVEGTERIAEGATGLGLEPNEPELASLAQAIDRMAHRIARGREDLLREKQFVEGMVENITSAVVSLSGDGRVLLLNRAAGSLLGLEVGNTVEDILASDAPEEMKALLCEPSTEIRRTTASFVQGDEEHDWTVVWVPVPGDGDPEALLVVEEVTDVLRGQRLAAWAEMARMIAHEIKNPLTPIRLSTEHLQRVWAQSPDAVAEVIDRCLTNILEQVDVLQETASDFSAYSRIPQALFEVGDLARSVSEIVDAYRASPPPGIEVRFEANPSSIPAKFDEGLLSRAVRNLVENSLRASEGGGLVETLVAADDAAVRIEVRDRGPGVEPENLRRIFEPYFSTSTGGTGLGLPIVRQVVEQHGGEVSAENRSGGGLRVLIEIPYGPGSLLSDL
ncbi:MAG: ATP-binding protein [Acidobacteriota bacterium]